VNVTENAWAFGGVQFPPEEARVVVIPVAYDLTTTYAPGARFGPRALLSASTNMELFDEELGYSPIDVGVHTMGIIEQIASGPDAMVARVAETISEVLRDGRFPILVGGEHSLTIGAVRALKETGRKVTILQFDAHADLRQEYQGSRYSHACVMARARETFPCVQIGIRSMSEPEHRWIRESRLPLFTARRVHEERQAVVQEILPLLGDDLYLTIDLDVLDPSILPSTGTPEPGGLSWEEILWLIRTLTLRRNVVGFDLMELSPIPALSAPDFLAAKLLNKVLGYTCPPREVSA
jgi:agmatinase